MSLPRNKSNLLFVRYQEKYSEKLVIFREHSREHDQTKGKVFQGTNFCEIVSFRVYTVFSEELLTVLNNYNC